MESGQENLGVLDRLEVARHTGSSCPIRAGQDLEAVRATRDEIDRRVRALVAELG